MDSDETCNNIDLFIANNMKAFNLKLKESANIKLFKRQFPSNPNYNETKLTINYLSMSQKQNYINKIGYKLSENETDNESENVFGNESEFELGNESEYESENELSKNVMFEYDTPQKMNYNSQSRLSKKRKRK